jgi:hypothetical protein
MATVTNTIKLPDGTTPDTARVEIELVASETAGATEAGWITASDITVLSIARPTVTNGAWAADLTPNANIDPSGTVYRVYEYVGRDRYAHYISVGSGGGAVHDLLAAAPTALTPQWLTTHNSSTASHTALRMSVCPKRDHGAVGDLTADDSAEMQAAIDEAAELGLPLVLDGSFKVTATLNDEAGAVAIEGPGVIYGADPTRDVFTLTSNGTSIRNLCIRGSASSSNTQFGVNSSQTGTADHILIENVTFELLNNGVHVNEGTGWTVSKCVFRQLKGNASGKGYGVLTGAGTANAVEGCKFYGDQQTGDGRHAVYFAGGATDSSATNNYVDDYLGAFVAYSASGQPTTTRCLFADNVITGGGDASLPESAQLGAYGKTEGVVITGNVVSGAAGPGVIVSQAGAAGYPRSTKVSGNHFTGTARCGVHIQSATDSYVEGNTFRSCGTSNGWAINVEASGTYGTANVERVTIAGNTVDGTAPERASLRFSASPSAINGARVSGNRFLGGAFGDVENSDAVRWRAVGDGLYGTTANRPSASAVGTGEPYWDTTLGKPIWSTGSAWVDATGASV